MVVMVNKKKSGEFSVKETHKGEESYNNKIPKEVFIIAQEIKIVKALACNNINTRYRQLKKLKKWLEIRNNSSFAFSEEDFLRLWKGLYYMFWLSDKPLIQEDLAEQFGKLLNCFSGDVEASVNFFGAFLRTMCQQWFGIDQWRMDKYLLLVRRLLRYMFRVIKDAGWTDESVIRFSEHLSLTVLSENAATTGLTMHLIDIFCEELAKVSEGKIEAKTVGFFVKPFITFFGTYRDNKLATHCRKQIFYHLLYQSSLGREHTEKYNAWRDMGFPTTCINDLEAVEQESGDEDKEDLNENLNNDAEKLLDPRAGNVDIFMPELPLDATYIINELGVLLKKEELNNKRRVLLKNLQDAFTKYQNGFFPLGVKRIPKFINSDKTTIEKRVDQLENMENEIFGTGRKLKQLNKRKRRKLLKSLNFDGVDENNLDEVIAKALPKNNLKQRKKKNKTDMMNGWIEEEISADIPTKKKKINNVTTNEKPKQQSIKQKIKSEANEFEPAKKIKKIEQTDNVAIEALKAKKTVEEINSKPLKAASSEVDKSKKQIGVLNKPKTVTSNTESVSKIISSASKIEKSKNTTEWDEPLKDGEVEYVIPSRKLLVKKANSNMVRNPLARSNSATLTPKQHKQVSTSGNSTPTPTKRVKIALKHNTSQNPSEYIKQIRSSPNVPYDANKKPGKGLLKPNSMPSPINPFYKKKIGLNWLNDTL